MNKKEFMRWMPMLLIGMLLVASPVALAAKSLVGQQFPWSYRDSVFTQPFIDVDQIRTNPQGLQIRYMHGGFADGTRFSFYFPVSRKQYEGRFFQYITPFPDQENLFASLSGDADDMASFSVSHGAYFIETNEGGAIDLAVTEGRRDASIAAYRANAACADFSRVVARTIYGIKSRPYGYIYGGSGGAYRTTGAMENTDDVWDGSVPFVLGSPNAIPNVFSVRMNALRVLHDKLPLIVDALEVGGSGDPTRGLNAQERAIWQETCRMGFPRQSWYGFRYMDLHGFVATYSTVVALAADYCNRFWTDPGYEGTEGDSLLLANRIQQVAVVQGFHGQRMCERLGLVPVIDESNNGTADRATLNAGASYVRPRALITDAVFPDVHFMVGDLKILSGKAKGEILQMHGIHDNLAVLSTVNRTDVIDRIQVGDTILVDNSRALACLFLHRHMTPGPEFYAWDQYRDANGQPSRPQLPFLLGPVFTQGAAGCLPSGNIHGKMILLESLYDREAYPWQADWYKKEIIKNKGQEFCDQNFRVWFTDRCTHGGVDDATQVVSYNPVIQQALLDVANWAEKGIEPSASTTYQIVDTQVEVPADATHRGGIQPSVQLSVAGGQRAEVHVGDEVMIHVVAHCPEGTGSIVRAELCVGNATNLYQTGSKGNAAILEAPAAHYVDIDLSQARYSADGTQVEFEVPVRYTDVGTYFPAVRVTSSRTGQSETYAQVQNLGRVRVVVEL